MKQSILFVVIFQSFLISCGVVYYERLKAPFALSVSEGFENPMGFHDSIPRFSWQLPQDTTIEQQKAYTIVVASKPELLPNEPDVWSSGKVFSDQSVDVQYKGEPLQSRQQVYWQVRYWDNKGNVSAWSSVARIEMGLLTNDDWKAQWIKIPDPKKWDTTRYGTRLFRPQYLRKTFGINSEVKSARLYITARGVFEAHINGKKIGDDALLPGWTPYNKRIETLTYDVTDALQQNKNTLGIILAEGWHSGRFGPKRRWDTVIAPPQVICQLEIEDLNGNTQTVITDKNWKATRKVPIRRAGLYDGEVYNASLEMPDWDQSNFDDRLWERVVAENLTSNTTLFPKEHLPVKTKKTLQPVAITRLGERKSLFDLGQNMVGVVQINIPVKKGDTIKIRHGEMLTSNGQLFTGNLGSALATDIYIANKKDTVTWQPKFTFHGFRYVEISGYQKDLAPQKKWVTGKVQHSNFEMSGAFHSSHSKLNQLHSNIQWGLRGNFFDVPLDCPQRSERLGWTGDAQVFIPTSMYLAEVHAFWAAWLKSMREEQFNDGGVPVVVPNFTGNFAQAGWSDACTIIPWELYYRTGDLNVLKDNYEMMKKWCNYHATQATNYISQMSTVGDWLQPYSQQEDDRRGDTPHSLISTAFYAQSVQMTMKTAEALGLEKDRWHYQQLFDAISVAFEKEFFNDNGKIKESYTSTQTAYLLALGFDLLAEDTANKAIGFLIEEIEATDNHLRTGFLGTPLLAPVLDKAGHTDLLFKILFQETYPSWFYPINQGATTMWERWDGYTHDEGFANRALSFNHYAYGAIGQWMYERIGGIAPLKPGYKKIRFAPAFNAKLSDAQASYESRYGKISSEWKFEEGDFVYNITIPNNTTGKIVIPDFGKRIPVLWLDGKKVAPIIINNNLILDNVTSGAHAVIYQNVR